MKRELEPSVDICELVVVTNLPLIGTLSEFVVEFLEISANHTVTAPQILQTANCLVPSAYYIVYIIYY